MITYPQTWDIILCCAVSLRMPLAASLWCLAPMWVHDREIVHNSKREVTSPLFAMLVLLNLDAFLWATQELQLRNWTRVNLINFISGLIGAIPLCCGTNYNIVQSKHNNIFNNIIFSLYIPAVFFQCFRKYCRFQSIHSQFYICIYLQCVTRTTCFGLSYFRPSSGPLITLLLAMLGAWHCKEQSVRWTWRWPKIREAETCRPRDIL